MKNAELAEIVIRVRDNKEENFRELFNAISQTVYYLSLKMLDDPLEAEDASQESLLYIYNHFEDLHTPEGFNTWMNRVVFGTCNSIIRRRGNPKEKAYLGNYGKKIQEERLLEPDSFAQNKEIQQIVLGIINQLPKKQKEVVLLYYYQEMTAKEIAEVLSCSPEAVSNRLYKAKQSIKDKVEGSKELQTYQLYSWGGFTFIARLLLAEMETLSGREVIDQLWDSLFPKIAGAKGHDLLRDSGEQEQLEKNSDQSDESRSETEELHQEKQADKSNTSTKRKTKTILLCLTLSCLTILLVICGVAAKDYIFVSEIGTKNVKGWREKYTQEYFQTSIKRDVASIIILINASKEKELNQLDNVWIAGDDAAERSQLSYESPIQDVLQSYQSEGERRISNPGASRYSLNVNNENTIDTASPSENRVAAEFEWKVWDQDRNENLIINEASLVEVDDSKLQYDFEVDGRNQSDAVFDEDEYRSFSEVTYHDVVYPQIEYVKRGSFPNGSELQVDDEITYSIIARNTGEASADYVILKDSIPDFTSFIIGSVASDRVDTEFLNDRYEDTKLLVWLIRDLRPGETVEVSFRVRVTDQAANKSTLIKSFAEINVVGVTDDIYSFIENADQFEKSNEIVYQVIPANNDLSGPRTGDLSSALSSIIFCSLALTVILLLSIFKKCKAAWDN